MGAPCLRVMGNWLDVFFFSMSFQNTGYIRKQYTERIDKEKSGLNLRITHLQNELQRLRTVNNRLDGLYLGAQEENTTMKQEIEAIHAKSKGIDETAARFSEENSALKAEVESVEEQVE